MIRMSGLLPAVLILIGSPTLADGLYDELVVCRGLPSDEARVICYDAAVDRSRRGDAQHSASAGKPFPAVEPAAAAASGVAAAAISQEELFGQNSHEVQRTVEEATGSERIDSISAQVTRLQQYDFEKVVISLDNGQAWKQIDSSRLRLKVGDDVTIERASFGSFMLRKKDSKRTMRVSRMD